MSTKEKNFFSSLQFISGLALVISTIIFSTVFYYSRSNSDVISVTGSASKEVVSDSAKFVGNFSRIVKLSALKTGYAAMATDLKAVKDFLKTQNIEEKDVVISTISMEQNYDFNQNVQTEKEYTLRQTVEVVSTDTTKITTLAQNVQALINKGVIFSVYPVEYYYKNLPEVRVSLLADAVRDAKNRADQIISSTGKKVGSLASASSGVVQVLPSNSLEISDYGTYDTSKINKTIMVTVKASFNIK
jgi:uncharacterized protein